MKKYLLDPYVISLLYQTKTDEETLSHYNEVMSKLFLLILETVKYHLEQNNVDKGKIDYIAKALEDPEHNELDEEAQKLLKDETLIKMLTESIDSFGKIIYDNLLPILPVEDRKELHRYLEAADPIVKYNALAALADLTNIDSKQVEAIDLKTLAGDDNTPVQLPPEVVESLSGLETKEDPMIIPEVPQTSDLPKTEEKFEELKIETNDIVQNKEVKVEQKIEENQVSDLPTIANDPSVPSIINSTIVPNLEPIPIPVVPGEVKEEVQNVVDVKPEIPEGNISEPTSDSLATPVKATIVEDEPVTDVSVLQTEPEVPAAETPVAPVSDEQQKVNAVSQLQNMGIDLNDALQHPPQS